jgi:DNA polymerase I-like protein with 3'-5' exonuclease and polymerase domains
VCVYNVGFEALVLLCKYPDLKLNIAVDVMRLVQLYDNSDEVTSYGLKPSAARILGPEAGGWEQEIRDYLIRHGHKPHEYHLAPRDILRRYNTGDVVATLRLYEHTTAEFERIGYDWRFDHTLYLSSARHIVGAQARGIKVEREALARYVEALEQELTANRDDFLARYAEPIAAVEEKLRAKEQAKYKQKIVERVPFNVDSNAHRELLFCTVMEMEAKFRTAKGNPSFKAKHLVTYGEAGVALSDRKSRQIVLTQARNLLALSEDDGKWHVAVKLSGTNTGRLAGGQS